MITLGASLSIGDDARFAAEIAPSDEADLVGVGRWQADDAIASDGPALS